MKLSMPEGQTRTEDSVSQSYLDGRVYHHSKAIISLPNLSIVTTIQRSLKKAMLLSSETRSNSSLQCTCRCGTSFFFEGESLVINRESPCLITNYRTTKRHVLWSLTDISDHKG